MTHNKSVDYEKLRNDIRNELATIEYIEKNLVTNNTEDVNQ